MGKINRNFKAGVFTHLFGEPENELDLYNAFSPVQYPPGTPVVDLTLNDALYMDRVNDLSFSVGGKLVIFFEHSSSINRNMALRYLIYCGRVYEKLIDNSEMYAERRVAIPTPEFFVLYNGVKPFPEKETYRLSDSFSTPPDGSPMLELIVTVYNVNPGFNDAIVRKSSNLYGYVTLVAKARELEQGGLKRSAAVNAAIKECIKLGVLAEYLKNNASEVSNMLIQEWDWDMAFAVREREAEVRERERWQSVVANKDAALSAALSADKDAALSEKDAEISEKDAEIAWLRAMLDGKQ
jgi:hypothetical protein